MTQKQNKPKDILAEEKQKERARRQEAKEQQVAYHEQYRKPVSVKTFKREIHSSTGVKTKTIERRFYENGVVKERLVKVEKNGKRIF